MKKVIVQSFAFLLLLAASAVQAQNPDEIFAKYFQNTGGLDKWKAVKTMQMDGKYALVAYGIELPIVSYSKAPNMARRELDFQGLKVSPFTYDGTTAWKLMPAEAGGSGAPEKMSDEEAKDMILDADMDSPLIDYATKGHTAELMGKETIEGTECFKIKFTRKTGKVEYYFFEPENSVLIMLRTTVKDPLMGEVEMDTFFSDYKEVGGLMVPHSNDVKNKGTSVQKVTWEKIQINAPIDEKVFAMPSK